LIRVFSNVDALSREAANLVAELSGKAVEKRGKFLLALSGGNSPGPLYERLAEMPYRDQIPWKQTWVFWSDERYVPLSDDRSNAGMAMKLLLSRVPVPKDQILPIYDENANAEKAATEYEAAILETAGRSAQRFDLILLGCGEDGHTASLFPDSPVLNEKNALVRAVQSPGGYLKRVTMTLPLLNQSRAILFILHGQAKAEIAWRILGDQSESVQLPAQLIRPSDGELLWFLDSEAALKLHLA
jgi:6-phosphogluconolactonase